MRGLAAVAIALLVAACGSAPQRAPVPDVPAGGDGRKGAYYKDDGPGDNTPADLDKVPDAVPRSEPLHRFANRPYEVFGRRYVPIASTVGFRERGMGSWYGRRYHGQRTSSGEPYDMYAMTAAHPTLPIPSYVRVTNPANGRSVVVRVNDRGPFLAGRVIDLSYVAAFKLGYIEAGSALLDIETVSAGSAAVPAQAAAPTASTAVAAASGSGNVFLQLGAFSARDAAEGFRARIYRQLPWLNDGIVVQEGGSLFRLHLGPYASVDAARSTAERIQAELGFVPLLINR